MRFTRSYWILFYCVKLFALEVYPAEAAILYYSGNFKTLSASFGQISQSFENITEQVDIIAVSSLPQQERENITVNQEETYQAFTICQPLSEEERCQEKIFIEEIYTGKYYQIQGLPLSWRPFTNLAWTNETILEFYRWSNPHYSLHYTVDMTEKKLVNVSEIELF